MKLNLAKSAFTLFVLLNLPLQVLAACQMKTRDVQIGSVSFGDVIVQRDVLVGSVLATAMTGDYNGGGKLAGCDTVWTYRWELSQWPTPSRWNSKVFDTNLPGVGVRLTNLASKRVLPYDQSVAANNYIVVSDGGVQVELIKTGSISGGTLTTGILARASVVNKFYFADVMLSGANTVTSVACSVTTPTVNVPLGKHYKSEFRGIGSGTSWQDVDILLECDKDARINSRIDAEADSSGLPGVLKIDERPGDMKARGVGVQLYYRPDDRPVQFGQETFYYKSPYGGQEIVKLKARYSQTGEKVIPGTANGTATFTLTYK